MDEFFEKDAGKQLPNIMDLMKKSDAFWQVDDDEPADTNRFAL